LAEPVGDPVEGGGPLFIRFGGFSLGTDVFSTLVLTVLVDDFACFTGDDASTSAF